MAYGIASMGKIINVTYEAGMGDVLMSLYGTDNFSSFIVPMVRKTPELRFRAILCTVSEGTTDLFKYNPYFCEFSFHTWMDDARRRGKLFKDQSRGFPYLHEMYCADPKRNDWPRDRMPFFLSLDEQKIYDQLAHLRYVVVHFFAREADRHWFSRIGNEKGANQVIRLVVDAGFLPVLVGSSYLETRATGNSNHYEGAAIEQDGVCNLIGCGTVRLHAALSANAAAVLGPISSFVSLAAHFDRRIYLMAPLSWRYMFNRRNYGIFSRLKEMGAVINYFEETPLEKQLVGIYDFLSKI